MAEVAVDPERQVEAARLAAPLSRFRCEGCGYGACCRLAPERCPMCGRCSWSFETGSPFSDDLDAPLGREVRGR